MSEPSMNVQKKTSLMDLEYQANRSQNNTFSELTSFILHNKKWWLAPVIVVLLAFGLVVALGGTGAAPFIYALF